jgi:hypothetical protein
MWRTGPTVGRVEDVRMGVSVQNARNGNHIEFLRSGLGACCKSRALPFHAESALTHGRPFTFTWNFEDRGAGFETHHAFFDHPRHLTHIHLRIH